MERNYYKLFQLNALHWYTLEEEYNFTNYGRVQINYPRENLKNSLKKYQQIFVKWRCIKM